MTIEANVWNKANSYWREMTDSATVTINVSVADEISFTVTGVPGVGSGETGFITQTTAGNFEARTLTGTANEITVTNGTGVSGNPTFSIPTAVTFTGKTITDGTYANLVTAAGTTAIPSATLTAGTNLTTAAAGALENDGKAFYATNVASSRQVINTEQFATVQGSDVSLTNNVTTAQSIFASANDVLSLAAATTYQFELLLYVATGTTTHRTSLGFAVSSALTSIRYLGEIWSGTSGTIGTTAANIVDVATASATLLNAANSAAAFTIIRARGLLRTNAATTITPQITFSAGPTGTCAVKTESFFRLWPIGSNTVAAVGNWA